MAALLYSQLFDPRTPIAAFRASTHAFHCLVDDTLKASIVTDLLTIRMANSKTAFPEALKTARTRNAADALCSMLCWWPRPNARSETKRQHEATKRLLANALEPLAPDCVLLMAQDYLAGCKMAGHMLIYMVSFWKIGTPAATALLDTLQRSAHNCVAAAPKLHTTNATFLVYLWINNRTNDETTDAMVTMLMDEHIDEHALNALAFVLMPNIKKLPKEAQKALNSVPDKIVQYHQKQHARI